MGKLKEREWYDDYYRDNEEKSGEYTKRPEDTYYWPVWSVVLDWIGNSPVYDLGCGPGQFALVCVNKGLDYFGTDFSEDALRMALNMTGGRGRFFTSNLEEGFPAPEGLTPDTVVVSLETFEHIRNDLQVLEGIPPGMRVIFSVPDFDYKSHVRYFKSIAQVKKRYQKYLAITRTGTIDVGGNHIFLVEGRRCSRSHAR